MTSINLNNVQGMRNAASFKAGQGSVSESFEDFKATLPAGSGSGENDMKYYLELQQQVLAETRAFETFSNIMKARHDAASNAIRNLK